MFFDTPLYPRLSSPAEIGHLNQGAALGIPSKKGGKLAS
jgi:hypothetical protein